jgi:predicted dehydrogenase
MALSNVLVVGVGSIGERHTRCFRSTGRAQVAICEPGAELRQRVAERYEISRSYAALGEALGSGQRWDAAVVATPAQMHVSMARRLIEAGVHTLIEKPLSTTLDGTAELIELVAKAGRVTGVAYIHRSNPVLESMQQAIASGRFGRPVQVVSVSGQHFPTYRPAYRSIYYTSRATGGGAIQDALTHVINAAEWLVGPADRVLADAAHQVLEGVQVEDTAHVLARHAGVLACYSINQYQAPDEVTLTVVCEGGTARMEFHNNRWLSMTQPGGTWTQELQCDMQRDDVFVRQANAFLDAAAGGRPFPCTLAEGLQTLRVNLAILAAAEGQAWTPV